MWLVSQKQNIPEYWRHDPTLVNKWGQTVAIIYVKNGIIPPKEWEHNPTLKNKNGWTTALHIAHNCKEIPGHQWHHNPNIRENLNGGTVEFYLIHSGFRSYPSYWRADDNLIVNRGQNTMKEIRDYYNIY